MPSHHSVVVSYDAVALTAMILFICSFLPAIFSRGVQRSLAWYSLMTAWLVYTLSYVLLIGNQEGPEPAFGLCMLQTILVYAVPPLVSTSMVCYCIEFYIIISRIKCGTVRQPKALLKFALVIMPWLVFLVIIIEVLLFIFLGRERIERAKNNFYCHLESDVPETVTASTVLANAAVLLPLEVWTGVILYQNWDVFKRLERADCQLVLTVYLRLVVCTLAALLAFVFSMLAFVFPEPDTTSIAYPILPIFIAFSFGTQKDVLRAWIFWKPSEPPRSILSYTSDNMITTNIYTSGGAVFDASTNIEMQSIEPERHPPANSNGQVISSSMPPHTIQNANRGTLPCGMIHFDLPKEGTISKLGTGN